MAIWFDLDKVGVSLGGNLLLNVVQYPDGSLPPESESLLEDLKQWMGVNAGAIHGTRPWRTFARTISSIPSEAESVSPSVKRPSCSLSTQR